MTYFLSLPPRPELKFAIHKNPWIVYLLKVFMIYCTSDIYSREVPMELIQVIESKKLGRSLTGEEIS